MRSASIPISYARVRQLGAVAQVLIAANGFADREGKVPSVELIAVKTGLQKSVVSRTIAKLADIGLLLHHPPARPAARTRRRRPPAQLEMLLPIPGGNGGAKPDADERAA
jgi:hypothetical protein